MSLPTIMRLDRVAVGTAHLAFGNLLLRLCDALGGTHVQCLVRQVVKVKRVRMGVIAAIDTPSGNLEVIQPPPDGCSALVRLGVHKCSVPRLFKTCDTPLLHALLWSRRSHAGPVLAQRRTELGGPLGSEGVAALSAAKRFFNNRFPRFHMPIIPDMYPCKPDIFEATYSRAARAPADSVLEDAARYPVRKVNRYCHANMCLETDADHEPDCPQGRAALKQGDIDCTGGSPCSTCPDPKKCAYGCVRQGGA